MDNQHKLIAGYRDLTEAEIRTINAFKLIEQDLADLLGAVEVEGTAAARWLAMARTNLETGIMYAIKAIARPTGGLGNPVSEQVPPITGSRQNENAGQSDQAEEQLKSRREVQQQAA